MKYFLLFILFLSSVFGLAQPGCTDPQANNYDPLASENDGSCLYDQTTITTELITADMPQVLNEQSGMIYFEDQVWIINDGGNEPSLFIWDLTTQSITYTIHFENFGNMDWESLEQDDDHLYIGDFGNNEGNRTDLMILVLNKSDLLSNDPENLIPDTIAFSYPEQTDFTSQFNNHNFDCEAFIVWQNQVYLFTKEWVSNITSIYKIPLVPGTYEAELLGTLPVQGLITGAGYDSVHEVITLLGYQIDTAIQPFVYVMWDFPSINFSLGNKRKLDLDWANYQTETIFHFQDHSWYVGSEYWEIGPVGFQNQLRKISLAPFMMGSTGLNEIEVNDHVKVFPNPSHGAIFTNPEYQLEQIFSLEGRKMNYRVFENGVLLETGLYILELKKGDRLYREKIIVVD